MRRKRPWGEVALRLPRPHYYGYDPLMNNTKARLKSVLVYNSRNEHMHEEKDGGGESRRGDYASGEGDDRVSRVPPYDHVDQCCAQDVE